MIQTFLHQRCSFIFSVFKILYDLNVSDDFFQYIILTQLRLEEVTVGERFSGFSQTLSRIVDSGPQDQILRQFSYQIFIFMCPLFTKYCAHLTKISDSNFACGVDLKCCYSNLMRILVCEVLNAAIFPEASKMILHFLVQIIYNWFKSFEWIPLHWLSFRATLHTLWKIAIYLTCSWLHVQQLFHFLVEHEIVNFPSSQVVYQHHPNFLLSNSSLQKKTWQLLLLDKRSNMCFSDESVTC